MHLNDYSITNCSTQTTNYSQPSYTVSDMVAAQPKTSQELTSPTMPKYTTPRDSKTSYENTYTSLPTSSNYYTTSQITSMFVKQHNKTRFIEDAAEIKDHIKEAFEKTTGEKLPYNLSITVTDQKTMKKIHEENGGNWSDSIMGFALNSNNNGTNRIFVKKGQLADIMVTLGHEIGHIISSSLDNARDEEAKAFAFSIAWVKAIREHNIANLKDSIIIHEPALNNLHNVALDFVMSMLQKGMAALEICFNLIKGEIFVTSSY